MLRVTSNATNEPPIDNGGASRINFNFTVIRTSLPGRCDAGMMSPCIWVKWDSPLGECAIP